MFRNITFAAECMRVYVSGHSFSKSCSNLKKLLSFLRIILWWGSCVSLFCLHLPKPNQISFSSAFYCLHLTSSVSAAESLESGSCFSSNLNCKSAEQTTLLKLSWLGLRLSILPTGSTSYTCSFLRLSWRYYSCHYWVYITTQRPEFA